MIVGTMWVMKGRCFDVTLSCMCIVLAPFRENFGRLHSTQPSRVIMAPRKQPTGRSEGTPQWTTAAAARLDRVASDLHRQIELVDANTGAQDVREPPEPGVAGARTTHAWMHGGSSNLQLGSRSGGASSSSSRPPSGIEPTAIPLMVGTPAGPLKSLAPAQRGGQERSHGIFHATQPKSWLLSALQVSDRSPLHHGGTVSWCAASLWWCPCKWSYIVHWLNHYMFLWHAACVFWCGFAFSCLVSHDSTALSSIVCVLQTVTGMSFFV